MNRLQKSWYKLTHWEFWPFSVFYFPVYFYFSWLALKSRSWFFFTAANPRIDFGGMLGEKKSEIFSQLPSQYIPETYLIKMGDFEEAENKAAQLGYPLIAKPDIGERGRLVEKISAAKELEAYVAKCPIDFLLQELVEFPVELGVFYVRLPNENEGRVTSIVQKKLMTVTGDGKSTIRQLLGQNPRAKLQLNFDHERFASKMNLVPSEGENVVVEPIGNHSRGTIFLDKTEKANKQLNEAIDRLAKQIPEFYFGRFDLFCSSFEELAELKNFKIVELNGAGAEPGHIYQPGFSLLEGYKVVFNHFKLLYEVSKQNKKKGFNYWTFNKGMNKLRAIKAHNKLIEPLLK